MCFVVLNIGYEEKSGDDSALPPVEKLLNMTTTTSVLHILSEI